MLVCDSPQWNYPVTTTLAVRLANTAPELTLAPNPIPFTLYQHPVVERATPTIFYARYPKDVAIFGHGFIDSNHTKCRFDERDVQGR